MTFLASLVTGAAQKRELKIDAALLELLLVSCVVSISGVVSLVALTSQS